MVSFVPDKEVVVVTTDHVPEGEIWVYHAGQRIGVLHFTEEDVEKWFPAELTEPGFEHGENLFLKMSRAVEKKLLQTRTAAKKL